MRTAPQIVSCLFMLSLLTLAPFAWAQAAEAKETDNASLSGDADLAQELSNPLADLMTIPIQMNYDRGIGPSDDGWKLQTNIQPVIPFHLNEDWNLISRTIMPVIYQEDAKAAVSLAWLATRLPELKQVKAIVDEQGTHFDLIFDREYQPHQVIHFDGLNS